MAILIALILLRWWLATLPGYPPDLTAYKRWALTGALNGIHTIYDDPKTLFDYPPLYAYLLTPVGKLYEAIAPEAARAFADAPTFSLLVKFPPLLFDVLVALLVAGLVRRYGLWGRRRTWGGWLPALLYLFLPPVLFDSAYWGQPDAVHSFFLLLSLSLILRCRSELGWIAAALACLMKPLALPFLPLLALATLLRSGARRLITGGLAAAAASALVLLPFLVTGRAGLVAQRLISDVGLMPYTSVNAHNLWWLLGPWRNADAAWFGPLTPKVFGLGLFGILYVAMLGLLWRVESQPAGDGRSWVSRLWAGAGPAADDAARIWFAAAAAVAFGFFFLSTHMHENHLFTAIPFLVLLAGATRHGMRLCLLAALSSLINMATHDLLLAHRWFSRVGGESSFFHPDLHRPLSNLEWGLATANSVFCALLFGALLLTVSRLPATRAAPPSSSH